MRVNVQLAVDVGDVRLHRAVREGEFLLDVGGVAASCQQAQHIGFTRGETVFAGELRTKGVQARANVGNRGLLLGSAAYGSMNVCRNRLTCLARRTPIARTLIHEDGRVVGVRASHTPRFLKDGMQLKGLHYDESIQDEADELTFHATKAVIVCTGGGMSNVEYRTMFDPRWTQEYDGVAGEPFSYADASGEIAGLSIGAGLGATANWTVQCKWP